MPITNLNDLIIRVKIKGYWYNTVLIDWIYGVVKYITYFAGLENEHEEHFHFIEDIAYKKKED